MEHAAAIDTSDLAVEKDFIGLKADVDLLDFHKLTNVPTCLNNLKTKVEDLDLCKLKTVPVDLERVVDVVDKKFV